MSIIDFYEAHNIDMAPQGNRHYRRGWVNTECPHCSGTFGYHLGYHLKKSYFTCHRCKFHPIAATVMEFLGVEKASAVSICLEYNLFISTEDFISSTEDVRQQATSLELPPNVPLDKRMKKYLDKRGFDPDLLEQQFGLVGTGHRAWHFETNYKFRIVAPIYWNRRLVSFQSRDYTKKAGLRYLTCGLDYEIIPHKEIIYLGMNPRENSAICVEGIFDVFRFIDNAFCTFGIAFTRAQVRLIAKQYKSIFTVFDPEPQAQDAAKELADELTFRGVTVNNIKLDSDPGDMNQDDADHLIRDINRKFY